MRSPRAAGGPAGFTLLEVLVALGILAIVLVSVYRLHSQTIQMAMETRFATQAPLLARSALARYEGAPQPELAPTEGDFGRDFPGYAWKIATEPVSSPTLGVELSRDIRRIDVAVLLNDGQYRYALRTYRLIRR